NQTHEHPYSHDICDFLNPSEELLRSSSDLDPENKGGFIQVKSRILAATKLATELAEITGVHSIWVSTD
ncbi:hypothetical protein, partial [Enterobacter hormaechei]|uniref:hypothetical protein n=1 Tax=Enterobacter hormaechei TaxID=158836 RepID=UPI00197F420B